MGYFFRNLSRHFSSHGATTHTICFNAGDWLFSDSENRYNFFASLSEWEPFFTNFISDFAISKIFLFGNCRQYHKAAIKIAQEAGIEVYVFEEGYIRPNYITLEKNGVNGDSGLPKDPSFYNKWQIRPTGSESAAENRFLKMALLATIYYLATASFKPVYPHYIHHRSLNLGKEFFSGLRNFIRKFSLSITERHFEKMLTSLINDTYYFVPLQTRTDFQLTEYSDFSSIEEFITEVITSFSKYAPPETYLVIKHHPMERGMSNYKQLISDLSSKHGVEDRVFTLFDVHLPTCLKKAIGTITINSTVGLSSLFHGTPTIALGTAIYDIEGLTCKGMKLDDFWTQFVMPDRRLFRKFRNYVIIHTQLNGGFYGRFPDFSSEKHC